MDFCPTPWVSSVYLEDIWNFAFPDFELRTVFVAEDTLFLDLYCLCTQHPIQTPKNSAHFTVKIFRDEVRRCGKSRDRSQFLLKKIRDRHRFANEDKGSSRVAILD